MQEKNRWFRSTTRTKGQHAFPNVSSPEISGVKGKGPWALEVAAISWLGLERPEISPPPPPKKYAEVHWEMLLSPGKDTGCSSSGGPGKNNTPKTEKSWGRGPSRPKASNQGAPHLRSWAFCSAWGGQSFPRFRQIGPRIF